MIIMIIMIIVPIMIMILNIMIIMIVMTTMTMIMMIIIMTIMISMIITIIAIMIRRLFGRLGAVQAAGSGVQATSSWACGQFRSVWPVQAKIVCGGNRTVLKFRNIFGVPRVFASSGFCARFSAAALM